MRRASVGVTRPNSSTNKTRRICPARPWSRRGRCRRRARAYYHPNYYGAFDLDPDGHNIETVCHEPAGG